ncbi:MAG: hypothetical protein HY908_20630 [Myxococcales bacterium]|nr:hypothetical protein [Myxococcales bacterium]
MKRSRVRVRWLALGALGCVLGRAAPARAEIRVAEEAADEGPEPERYLDIGAWAQPGIIWRQNDENATLDDDGFWLQRARLGTSFKAQHFFFGKLELDLTPTPGLGDAYIDGRFHPAIYLRLGQFQVPFLKTFQFNELNLAFIDRTIYTPLGQDRPYLRYLSPRDIGVMAGGRVGGSDDPDEPMPAFDYRAGAFLGRGPNQTRNDDDAFLYTARVQLHALGVPDGELAENDIARNVLPRVAVGGGVYTNCDDRGQWNRGFTVDGEVRYQGLYASTSFVWFKNGASSGLGNTLGYGDACKGVAGAPDHIASGFGVQLQYVLPREWTDSHAIEVLTRYDSVEPNGVCDLGTGQCAPFGGDASTPGYAAPPNYGDSDNAPSRYRLTFGVNYLPTSEPTLRLSVNYQLKRERENVVTAAGTVQGLKDDVFWMQLTAGI